MPKGEARRNSYKPGVPRPKFIPAEEGDYDLELTDFGKPGLAGWKVSNPKKFPNRMVRFTLLGTEDEVSGKEKTVVEFFSASPGAFFKVADYAAAIEYPVEMNLPTPESPKDTAAVKECCSAIDALLEWAKENAAVVKAHVTIEEYKGKDNNRISEWLTPDAASAEAEPADEDDATEDEEEVNEDSEQDEDEDADEDSDGDDDNDDSDESDEDEADDDEEEAPVKSKSKVKPGAKVLPLGSKKAPPFPPKGKTAKGKKK